jgi:Flp pilus assembly protein TadD
MTPKAVLLALAFSMLCLGSALAGSTEPTPLERAAEAGSRCGRGYALGQKKQWKEALAEYQRAAELDPAGAEAWEGIGWACY